MPFNRLVPELLAFALSAAMAACGEIDSGERLRERCIPGSMVDEDNDQRVDCADPDCDVFPECGGNPSGPPMTGGDQRAAYRVRLLFLSVAREDQTAGCFDTCPALSGRCPCLPDPYIHMIVVDASTDHEELAWRTLPVPNTLTATFEDAELELELEPDDAVVLRVYDDDDPDEDDLMFECDLELPDTPPREVTCRPDASDPLIAEASEVRLLVGTSARTEP